MGRSNVKGGPWNLNRDLECDYGKFECEYGTV